MECLFSKTRLSENVGFTGATIRGVAAQRDDVRGVALIQILRVSPLQELCRPHPKDFASLSLSLSLLPPPPSLKFRSLFFSLLCPSVPQRVTLEATDGREERRRLQKQLQQALLPPSP